MHKLELIVRIHLFSTRLKRSCLLETRHVTSSIPTRYSSLVSPTYSLHHFLHQKHCFMNKLIIKQLKPKWLMMYLNGKEDPSSWGTHLGCMQRSRRPRARKRVCDIPAMSALTERSSTGRNYRDIPPGKAADSPQFQTTRRHLLYCEIYPL